MDVSIRTPQLQYSTLLRQREAATLGMWVFVGSELLFFSPLFAVYAASRAQYGELFREAAHHADLALGTANTFILLASSYLVALAVTGPRRGSSRYVTVWLLAGAIGLGIVFLGFKSLEYVHHFSEGIYPATAYRFAGLPQNGARVFFTLYYFMTGLHALHVLAGIAVLAWLARRVHRGDFSAEYDTPLELGGMFWHLVDIIWLFLWPCFYLLR